MTPREESKAREQQPVELQGSDDEKTLQGSGNLSQTETKDGNLGLGNSADDGGHSQQHRQQQQPAEQPAPSEISEGPPPLPYNLREHKLTIAFFWFLIATECCFVPISFYYGLSNATDLRPGAMFAIITSVFGFVSGYEYGIRGWRLIRKTDNYRPLNGSPRYFGFDSTQYTLFTPFFVMTAVMIGFSIPHPPVVRGLAVPLPLGLIIAEFTIGAISIAHALRWKLKYFRLSSHPKGAICPPLTFCIMEDITATDGKGGKEYREVALARYNASPRFRRLLVELALAWSISSIALGAVLIAVIYNVRQEVAYGIGWAVPTLYGAIGAWSTILYVQRSLRIEKENWAADQAAQATDRA